MSDWIGEEDESLRSPKDCRDRFEITLRFSDANKYTLNKDEKEITCRFAELARIDLNRNGIKDYLLSRPDFLRRFVEIGSTTGISCDKLVDVEITDKMDYYRKTLQRFAKRPLTQTQFQWGDAVTVKKRTSPSESDSHKMVKSQTTSFLEEIGIEAYTEVVFYPNAGEDFYKWQRRERRQHPDKETVAYRNSKEKFGRQIEVDVTGWLGEAYKFQYPVVAIEVMKSSNLRDEVNNLMEIWGRGTVFSAVVDVYGELGGQINNIPIIPLEIFESGIPKRIQLIKEAIGAGKSQKEIFELGKKYNVGKLE